MTVFPNIRFGKSSTSLILALAGLGAFPACAESLRFIAGGESAVPAATLRRMVVGPGFNQPQPFSGYGGSVAWAGIERSKDDALVVAFNAGYWHVSPPTPFVMPQATLERYGHLGFPVGINAPTGGRIMFTRSTDHGRSWSTPQTLFDTPADDRQAGLLTLSDGTMLASFFTSYGEVDPWGNPAWFSHTLIVRSSDGGRTWEKTAQPLQQMPGSPLQGEAADGPAVLLANGTILLTAYGYFPAYGNHRHTGAALYRSQDRGARWELLSTVVADHDLEECHTVQLRDGRLLMVARPEGDLFWSNDVGRTWSLPKRCGIRLYAPTLYVLRDGTVVCLHGSYAPGHGGLRVIFSTDGGATWFGSGKDHGLLVDADAYGYGAAVRLPDDTLELIYQKTASVRPEDAKSNSLWTLRLRVRSDHSGIDLLPPVY